MKKLNATNAIAVLSLGLIFSVVVAGCGGNDTSESALTKNAALSAPSTAAKSGSSDGGAGGGSTTSDTKTGSSDGGAGGDTTKSAPTTEAKTGSSDGGTGESVIVSDSELSKAIKNFSVTLTNVQMNALTSAQWETVDGLLSASQVASIPTKTIQNLSTTVLEGLNALGTAALTDAQLNSMSTEQLNALISSKELTEAQLVTVNARLKKLG